MGLAGVLEVRAWQLGVLLPGCLPGVRTSRMRGEPDRAMERVLEAK